MTTIILPVDSENISANLAENPVSEDETDKIKLSLDDTNQVLLPPAESLSNTNNEVSLPSSESSTSYTDQNKIEISAKDNESFSQVEKKIAVDSEIDKSEAVKSTEDCDDVKETSSSPKPLDREVDLDKKINQDKEQIPESDEDDDDNFASFKFNKKSSQSTKKFTLIDSDSEDENIFMSKKQNDEETSSVSGTSVNTAFDSKTKKKSRIMNVLDTDSEDDSGDNLEVEKSQKPISQPNNFKKLTIIDSDSENESPKSSDDFSGRKKKSIQNSKKMSSARKDLIDSDDSETNGNTNTREFSAASVENKQEGKKKRKGSARASKDAAMQQIHSESQRLIRESEISLPYHRPKQRTLQEFLNRKKISSSLPKTLTTAAKVKMFDDIIIKAVEEKEKEAEMFYKSSDSEEETQLSDQEEIKAQDSIDQSLEIKAQDSIDQDLEIKAQDSIDQNLEIKAQDSIDQNLETKAQDAIDKNIEIKNIEDKIDVDRHSEQNEELHFASSEVPSISNVTEETSPDISNKSEETPMECSVDKNISHVSRKLFENEFETEKNSIEQNKDSEKARDEEKAENSNKDNTEDTEMETDTNDFELRFSVNDFDTELNLKDLDGDCIEIETSSKSGNNEKEEIVENLLSINGKKREDEDLAEVISKGHVLGLPPPSFEDNIIRKKSLKQKILSRFLNMKPTLHGSPGTTIELSEEVNHEGVKKLVDRFVRHSQIHKIEENPEVIVIQTEKTPEGLKIVEQVLPYKMPNAPEEPDLHKPGAKLQKFREELQQRISSKRNEEWRQKEEAAKALEEEFDDEFEPEDKDELPDEEAELDDESAESEPEENDVLIKENKKSTFSFADDEAEVSDDENQVEDDEEEENEENDEEEEDKEVDEDEEEEDDEEKEEKDEEQKENDDENDNEDSDHPKILRRITTAFQDDSDLSEPEDSEKKIVEQKKKIFQRMQTDVDMFDDVSDGWTSEVEENRTKPIESSNSICQTPQFTLKHQNLISPITQLTVLKKNCNSTDDNFGKECDSLDQLNDSFSQDSISNLQNKLFQTAPNTVNDEEIMDLCSGIFTETSQVKSLKPLMNPPSHPTVTESQLLELCSGSFSTQIDENSQDMKLTLDEGSKSPVKYPPKKVRTLQIMSSDEEEDEDTRDDGKKKKKIAKLVLSDDEDDEKRQEESDLSEEEELLEEENEEQFVDYDSEENEVVMIPKKDIGKVAAKKFLEAEAELSESEWGSEDEDERDLDKLEKEDGDDDEIDEDQMRKQLGKIHARQVLDDDQREVRLLQDMLFEDGDLHSDGAGRERKFRWKNIDKLGDWDDLKSSEDPELMEDVLEDNSELELRKCRYEKEKFFEKEIKDSVQDIEEEFNDSEIFKCGLRVVNTIIKKSVLVTEESAPIKSKKPLAPSIISSLLETSTINKSSSMQLPIRGSFLARGEATLARIASIINEKDKMIRAPLNGRRFVFEHISPSVKDAEKNQDEEEPSPSTSTTKFQSRKRTSMSDSTPKSIKKMKVGKESGGKKLFS